MKRRILSALLALMIAAGAITAAHAAKVDLAEGTAEAPAEEVSAEESSEKDVPAPTAANYPDITRITPTADGLQLTWTAYANAAAYKIFIRRDTGGWKVIGTSVLTTFEHTGLVSDTFYTYTVRAVDASGKFISDYNTDGHLFHYLATPVLTGTESVNEGQMLTWEPVDGADVYRVYIRSSDKWIVAGDTDTEYAINPRVTSGKAYTYTVRCWDLETQSALSYYDAEGITGVYIATPEITAFNAVGDGVEISWTPVDGAAAYGIFRKLSTGWKRLATTTGTSFTDTGLRTSTRYVYTVRCLNSAGKYCSGYNAEGWAFDHLESPEITDIKFRNEQYTIKWNAHNAAAGYHIFRKELGGDWQDVGSSATNSFTDTTADKDGTYTYAVRSVDKDGNFLTAITESGRWYRLGIFVIGMDGTGKPNTRPAYTCEVTEEELREQVAIIAGGWMGAVEGDAVHQDILAYYNTYEPLAFDYHMSTADAWCAAFTSAVWIRAGIAPYICTECGCGRFIDFAEQYHIWTESDGYVPKVGDAIIYNWSDSGYGECVTGADHVGLVTAVDGNNFVVTEGNTGDGVVDSHDRVVNQTYIRGYITPNYAQIAQLLSLKARFTG